MLKSRQQAMDELRCALDAAMVLGVEGDEIKQMLAERVKYYEDEQDSRNGTAAHGPETECLVYDPGDVPAGLISLPDAAKKYGIPLSTLRNWTHRGKLPKCGRVRAKAPGGGYILTKENQIEYCRDHPRKRGPKPRNKSFEMSRLICLQQNAGGFFMNCTKKPGVMSSGEWFWYGATLSPPFKAEGMTNP